MAIVTRYFGVTGNGAADGTTWADRAALFSGGWSTVITNFAFNGADSLKCMIGPGSYSLGTSLNSASWTNPPSATNPLWFVGCDSSGNELAIPDPDWVSNQPAWDDSTLPVLNFTGNFSFSEGDHHAHLIKVTGSARNGILWQAGFTSWCVVENSTNNTSAQAVAPTGSGSPVCCVFRCTAASYAAVGSVFAYSYNCRLEGVTGSSGNRSGFTTTGNTGVHTRLTIVGVGGDGYVYTSTSTAAVHRLFGVTIANVGGTGFKGANTAGQTGIYALHNAIITGCGGYGIDMQGEANCMITNVRLRDNTSGNINGTDNWPVDVSVYTADDSDANEYVDAANGDFRIKSTSALWGKGYGVADYVPSAAEIAQAVWTHAPRELTS